MERVLIFDDDADILEVCTIVLRTHGFEVITEKNCDDILAKIDLYTPDVLLMDNKIPPMGGIQACRAIRASSEHAGLPIVFFSANQDVERLAEQAGADHFIEKPFDLDALVSTLRSAITAGGALH
ncbi:MAG TPA: response regulator [Puia sp.]|nr:response regulator [Puia sp.]